jgi:hypothetical protein
MAAGVYYSFFRIDVLIYGISNGISHDKSPVRVSRNCNTPLR